MVYRGISSRDAVLQAMAEHDRLGDEEFLQKYGFGRPSKYWVEHDDRLYPAKAIVGAAHQHEHGEQAHNHEFTGGERQTNGPLQRLGFIVRNGRGASSPDWSAQENTLLIDAYLTMLSHQLAGRPTSSRGLRTSVGRVTGRGEKAVGRKASNLSAALEELDLPVLRGFSPLPRIRACCERCCPRPSRNLGGDTSQARAYLIPRPTCRSTGTSLRTSRRLSLPP